MRKAHAELASSAAPRAPRPEDRTTSAGMRTVVLAAMHAAADAATVILGARSTVCDMTEKL